MTPTDSRPTPASRRRLSPDALAVAALIVLWLLYFWRIFTPVVQDQLSLIEGDFSGQFVAFFGYQVDRLSDSEIPLWDPYQYGGFPFLADTQSAVFYPPRLLTVVLVSAGGTPSPGDLYAALQAEMAAHVLLGTLLMYAFVRRLTARDEAHTSASIVAGLVAALTFGYGGYLSGYPQLQLAILEAGIWLPLALLGIFNATRTARTGWLCLVLSGVALGLSLLAGHPQTTLFALYVSIAFLGWRLWQHADGAWRRWLARLVPAALLIGVVAGGLAAVQLLPGLEYLRLTSRSDLTFDARGNGFPFEDVAQIIFPSFMTLWSPLYFGIAGLVLAAIALARRAPYSAFFGIAGLIALGLSFGAGTVIYDAAYLFAPGVSWFRGQERAAFVVAQCAAVLAGLGAYHVLSGGLALQAAQRAVTRGLWGLLGLCALVAGVLFVLWLGPDRATYDPALRSAVFAACLAALTLAALTRLLRDPAAGRRQAALVALVVFDLFSVTMGLANWEAVPARDRLAEPAAIAQVHADLAPGARVGGTRGLSDNWGSLYRVADIHTISPLRLRSIEQLFDALPDERMWDLLAVQTVLTDWNELPVSSTIVATAEDGYGSYNVHALDDPRGFAHLTYGVTVVGSDAEARGLLSEPAYDARQWVLLDRDPGLDLPAEPPADPGSADVTLFEPEHITIQGDTAAPAVLTLALPDYPGWQATVNGHSTSILRAYGGLSAVALREAGSFTVELHYRPRSFTVGAALSLLTLAAVIATLAGSLWRSKRHS